MTQRLNVRRMKAAMYAPGSVFAFILSSTFLCLLIAPYTSYADTLEEDVLRISMRLTVERANGLPSVVTETNELPPLLSAIAIGDKSLLIICLGKASVQRLTANDFVGKTDSHLSFYKMEANAGNIATVGSFPVYHKLDFPNDWRFVDGGTSRLLWPTINLPRLGPLSPVYRLNNPGGWTVQPQRSVNPRWLPNLNYARIVRGSSGKPNIEIKTGQGKTLASATIAIPAASSITLDAEDCGTWVTEKEIYGLLGFGRTQGGYTRLATYRFTRTASLSQPEADFEFIETDDAAKVVGIAGYQHESFLRSVFCNGSTNILFFWKNFEFRTPTGGLVKLQVCFRKDGGQIKPVDWYAFSVKGKEVLGWLESTQNTWQMQMSPVGNTIEYLPALSNPLLISSPDSNSVLYSTVGSISSIRLEMAL